MVKRFISAVEVAEQLSLSKRAVNDLIRKGLLPAHNFGGRHIRIEEADLKAFIDKAAPRKE